ncbi:MAG TPA: methionyl-tRNA formyltransferase [Steroidobacteraceae bacterium]
MTAPLRLVFAGTPDFAVPALTALHAAGHEIVAVYTQPDRPAGRGRELAASPVKRRALELGCHVEQPASLKTAEARQRLASFAPDLMVVVAYGLILPQAVLDVPRLGCLNIHASLLPRWRGAAPIQRAVLAGDDRTGISIMLMDAGLDTGPELLRKEVAIGARETGGELHDRLAPLGAAAIVEAVAGWAGGRLQPQPQPVTGATYAAKIRKDEARIDWTQPAAAIDRQVRAFNPWPVAETRLGGEQVRVWLAEPVADLVAPTGEPGSVLDAPEGRLFVATGEGVLELLVLQFPGRKALRARDVLNSRSLRGARFEGAGP